MKAACRKEDMSPNGSLSIAEDDDGDILVMVHQDDGNGTIEMIASVEFCTIGLGGGQSPHTRRALVELAEAMEIDNRERPGRAGETND